MKLQRNYDRCVERVDELAQLQSKKKQLSQIHGTLRIGERSYKIVTYTKEYSRGKQMLQLIKAIAWTVCTLSFALMDMRVRHQWTAGFTGRVTKIVAVPQTVLSQVGGIARPAGLAGVIDTLEGIYGPGTFIYENRENLDAYATSLDFKRHASTVKIYHHPSQPQEEAHRVATEREPVNIGMNRLYDEEAWKAFSGHARSAYCQDVPVTNFHGVSIYSETYLWNNGQKKEVAILSLPAPALDVEEQPSFSHYVQEGRLTDAYEVEHQHLARTVLKAALDHQDTAFQGAGINRLILSQYGLSAFLDGVSHDERPRAQEAYCNALSAEIIKNKLKAKICISCYSNTDVATALIDLVKRADPNIQIEILEGDIKELSSDRDLIVNAWDPHSNPGNGNEGDNSFDGHIGRASGILLTQTVQCNSLMKDRSRLAAVPE